jgi:CheY-like chemotaxis protein
VLLSYLAVAVLGCVFVWKAGQEGIMGRLDQGLDEASREVQARLRGPALTFETVGFAVRGMLDDGKGANDVRAYLAGATELLQARALGMTRGSGVPPLIDLYGVLDGEPIEGSMPGSMPGSIPGSVPGSIPEPARQAPATGTERAARAAALPKDPAGYSAPYLDGQSGSLIVSLSQELEGADGLGQGVLCLDLGLGFLESVTSSLKVTKGAQGLVLGRDGRVLAASKPGMDFGPLSPFGGVFPELGKGITSGDTLPYGAEVRDGNGRAYVVYLRPLFNGWLIGTLIPAHDFHEPFRGYALAILILAVLLSLVTFAFLQWLANGKAKAEEENWSKTGFLTRISHEIRTPMNAIVGMSDLLLRSEDEMSSQCRAWSFNIKHAGDILLSIINDILDYSNIRSNAFKFVPLAFTLSSLVNDVINISQVRLREKSLEFLAYVDAKLPNNLFGDVTRIRQIVLNLLSNAAKYTFTGHVRLSMTGSLTNEGKSVALSIAVEDTGIGIRAEDRGKLFQDYSRVNPQEGRHVEGTGLGLTITKSLCDMMHGTIGFDSVYGKGSTFTVVLPLGVEGDQPFAKLAYPDSIKVLMLVGEGERSRSYAMALDDLKVGHTIVHDKEEFSKLLAEGGFTHILLQDNLAGTSLQEAIAGAMGAEIAVMTDTQAGRPGRGHTYVSGPLYSLPLAEFLEDQPHEVEREIHREAFIIPQARVLVVDDLETNLQVAQAMLSEYRCQVDLASSGREAISLVAKNDYDLVFMDHMMPMMDGLETTKIIRGMEGGKHSGLPILALTANAVSGMREMFLAHGMNDFVSKPMDLIALESALRHWVPAAKIVPLGDAPPPKPAGLGGGRGAPGPADGGLPDYSGMMAYGAKVLIVDDLPTNLEVAKAIVAEFGCSMDVAGSGAQAIERIETNRYDLVLMDHMMPGMDGIEATRAIRAMDGGKFKDLPIIALTANTVLGMRETFLANGFDDYVPKPIDVRVMERVLGTWLPQSLVLLPPKRPDNTYGPRPDAPVTTPASTAAGANALPEDNSADALVDFLEGEENTRSKEGYRRVLKVFLKEAADWVRRLQALTQEDPFSSKESQTLLRDMGSSATIIGAFGLAGVARHVADVAKNGDFQALKRAVGRLIKALAKIQANVLDYLTKAEAMAKAEGGSSRDSWGAGFARWTYAPPAVSAPQPPAAQPVTPPVSKDPAQKEARKEARKETRKEAATVSATDALAQSPGKGPEEMDVVFEKCATVDFELGLARCRGKVTNYNKLLSYYMGDLKQWIDILKDYPSPDSPDLRFMTITFHSMKSASATIGAMGLSEEAKKLEAAGRSDDNHYIEDNAEKCLGIMEKVKDNINKYLESRNLGA